MRDVFAGWLWTPVMGTLAAVDEDWISSARYSPTRQNVLMVWFSEIQIGRGTVPRHIGRFSNQTIRCRRNLPAIECAIVSNCCSTARPECHGSECDRRALQARIRRNWINKGTPTNHAVPLTEEGCSGDPARSDGADHQLPVSKQSDPVRQVVQVAVLGNLSAGLRAFGSHDNKPKDGA
jgi:hypothetical protein